AALHEESGVLRGLRGAAWATRIGSAPRLAGSCRELDWVLVLPGECQEFVSALLPPPRQLADFRRVLRREVSRLGAVGGEVVQLPGPVAAGGHELPVPHADGTVALVLPPQVVMPYRAVAGEDRHEALAGRCRNGGGPAVAVASVEATQPGGF